MNNSELEAQFKHNAVNNTNICSTQLPTTLGSSPQGNASPASGETTKADDKILAEKQQDFSYVFQPFITDHRRLLSLFQKYFKDTSAVKTKEVFAKIKHLFIIHSNLEDLGLYQAAQNCLFPSSKLDEDGEEIITPIVTPPSTPQANPPAFNLQQQQIQDIQNLFHLSVSSDMQQQVKRLLCDLPEQHRQLLNIFEELCKMPINDPKFDVFMRRLHQDLKNHIDTEELILFPVMFSQIPMNELLKLRQSWENERQYEKSSNPVINSTGSASCI